MILTTSSLERNSQTPSLAITINLSASVKFISRISGSAITPTSTAA
jgi:hypothetical protein